MARTADCPTRMDPQLVSPATTPPTGDWSWELKLDGFRMLARIDHGTVALFTRNGHDWSTRMPRLVGQLQQLPVETAWLDGEVVIQDEDGRPVFQLVQSAFATGSTDPLVYFAFDLLFVDGEDLRLAAVEHRRDRLHQLVERAALSQLWFSDSFDVEPTALLQNACAMQLEGIVGKRRGSPYTSRRSGDWVKIKCNSSQDFVIVGYTRAAGGIGSLLLGLHDDDGRLLYAGRVQSGFTRLMRQTLYDRLSKLAIPDTQPGLPQIRKGLKAVWVMPKLACEVRLTEITPNGKVRHGVFMRLREDVSADGLSLESSTPEEPPEPS